VPTRASAVRWHNRSALVTASGRARVSVRGANLLGTSHHALALLGRTARRSTLAQVEKLARLDMTSAHDRQFAARSNSVTPQQFRSTR
jgi:hypothetical protein